MNRYTVKFQQLISKNIITLSRKPKRNRRFIYISSHKPIKSNDCDSITLPNHTNNQPEVFSKKNNCPKTVESSRHNSWDLFYVNN